MSLPQELAPHSLTNAASARAVRITALPTNAQTFGSGALVRIQIPRRPRAFLIPSGSFLRFDVQVNATMTTDISGTPSYAGVTFDGHASALIDQLATYHNSTQLEVILGYNRLYNVFLESQVARESKVGQGQYSISGGACDTRVAVGAYLGAGSGAQVMSGVAGTPGVYSFCVPLISSLFGSGQNGNRYIPLDRLNSDLIMELTLADFRNCFKVWKNAATTNTTWTPLTDATYVSSAQSASIASKISIQNVQFVGQLVELDDSAIAIYNRINPKEIELPVTQYRGYLSSLTGPLSSASVLVPARFQSTTALIWAFYNQAYTNDLTSGTVSWRQRANLASVSYRIGSLQYPPRPISCDTTSAEVFMEVEKALRTVSCVNGNVGFSKDEYTADTGAGAFCGMQELAVFPFAEGTTFAGINSLGQNMYVDLTFTSALLPSATFNCWIWAKYDAKLLIDETGSMRVVY